MTEHAAEDGLFRQKTLPGYPDRIGTLVDWPPWDRDDYEFGETNSVCNAFLHGALLAMAELTGDEKYRARAAAVRKAFRQTFLKDGHFTDNAESSHASFQSDMFALRFGLAEPSEIPGIMAALKARGMVCSVYGAQFLLETCFCHGEAQYGLDLMRSRGRRSWLSMMEQGATITMESWGNWDKPNQDWCHAWGTAPANVIPRHLCGVRPIKPGFAQFAVDPQPGDLDYFLLRQPTPHGPVILEKHPDGHMALTVPEKTEAIYRGQLLPSGRHDL